MKTDNGLTSRQTSRLADAASRIINTGLALCIAPFAAPVVGVVFIFHKALNGWDIPFFYSGVRMGRNKKIFHIIKIRTLKMNAEQQVGGDLLQEGSGLELRMGKLLRTTRIDELPQLYNIIRGDMEFVGPRPVRPAQYEINKHIPGYEIQFLVKPGLTGISQLMTAYGAPKRVRSFIDNRYITYQKSPLWDLQFIVRTAIGISRNVRRYSMESVRERINMYFHARKITNHRKAHRVSGDGILVTVFDRRTSGVFPNYDGPERRSGKFNYVSASLVDINHEALCIRSSVDLYPGQNVRIVLEAAKEGNGRRKPIRLKGTVYRIKKAADPKEYVLTFTPVSSLDEFRLDQYVLKTCIG